jgi:hypothetical protein
MEPIVRNVGRVVGTLRAEYRQLNNRYFGTIERFDGNAREVCAQIVDKLWEGDFYRTSLGHFDFFWMRDFGTVCEALVHQGHEVKVHHTLQWALRHYRRAGSVTLCIDKAGRTFNAPDRRSIDAIPWLLHCLVVSNYHLNAREHAFLNKQVRDYVATFLDKDGQLQSIEFAEMRDAVIYDRSAYAVALVARMAKCARYLQLTAFPFGIGLYQQELLDNYWNGSYFNADRRTDAFSAECALMPFWLGVINDAEKAARTFDYITEQRLNLPYPLRYTNTPEAFRYRWWMTAPFMPNYAGTSVWSWHGAFYLKLLQRYKRPEFADQYASFARMIDRHDTFPEMLNADGSWYLAPVYKGDPGMVWAALFLDL